jgi:arylformamidase
MTIIDISPLISENTAVWPGDTPFSKKINMRIEDGDPVNLSSIASTLHLGAHIDAPSHIMAQGTTIDNQPLDIYYGKCQLIEVKVNPGKHILPDDIKDEIKAERILLKSESAKSTADFNNLYHGLSGELIEYFYANNVRLIGVNTPSVDAFEDESLPVHKQMCGYHMVIIEGLVLDNVEPGIYTLIAFPLKIKAAEASPVRAVLLK